MGVPHCAHAISNVTKTQKLTQRKVEVSWGRGQWRDDALCHKLVENGGSDRRQMAGEQWRRKSSYCAQLTKYDQDRSHWHN